MSFLSLLLLLSISSLYYVLVQSGSNKNSNEEVVLNTKKINPFTAKASLIRYWNNKVSNDLPKPDFLFSKASPVGPTESAILSKLVSDPDSLPTHLDSFCSLAALFCSFDSKTSQLSSSRRRNKNDTVNFAEYSNRRFANYGDSVAESFRNYSADQNSPRDSFRRYGGGAWAPHASATQFSGYSEDSNVAATNFTSYSGGSSGEFRAYHGRVNVVDLRFSSYASSAASKGRTLGFSSYASETNTGSESFTSYVRRGNGSPVGFESYADGSNTVGSGFTGYGELGTAANDSFKGYGLSGNNPRSEFRSYGAGGVRGLDEFKGYRTGANVGLSSFSSYAKNSKLGRANFANYGKSFNLGNDSFKEYGKGASGKVLVGFRSYSLGRSFKDYAKSGVGFAEYNNFTTMVETKNETGKGSFVIRGVEKGKFFRERMLKEGRVMVMPNIRDKMPKRPFLPRFLLDKISFSMARVSEVKKTFGAKNGSITERVIVDAITECERAPSPGETKKCVGSAEDMINFAISVLSSDVVVRTTDNVNGSKRKIMIGKVRAINDGELTKSVSCHQSLYPYLLYYCHSVPKVRIYDTEILDAKSRVKINRGIAVCHIDTSSWAPGHSAFVSLGSGPGQIEICHWIYENDMSWTVADH